MKILITGGAGNIGSALTDKLSEDDSNRIVVVDNLTTGEYEKVPKKDNVRFIKADVNDYQDIAPIMNSNEFSYVFHYAAVVGVQRTLNNPLQVFNDIDGIRNILNLSKNTGVSRVIFSSSSEVYGEPVEIPQHEETTPLNSKLPYAIVKNVGEAYCRAYYKEFGLPYTIFRFFNTYGPNQSEDFVIPRFLKAALNNEDITIYGEGNQTRTFCFVEDNIQATIQAAFDKHYENMTINIGNDDEKSVLELAHRIISVARSGSRIVHVPALKEGDMTRRKPDISIMKQLLSRELVSIEDGIKMLIGFYAAKNLHKANVTHSDDKPCGY